MALARFEVTEGAVALMGAQDLKKVAAEFVKGEVDLCSTPSSDLRVFEMWVVGAAVSSRLEEAPSVSHVQYQEATASSSVSGCSSMQQQRVFEVLLQAAQVGQLQALEEEHHLVGLALVQKAASSSFQDPNRISSHLLHSSVALACLVRITLPIVVRCPSHYLPRDCLAGRYLPLLDSDLLELVADLLVSAAHLQLVARLSLWACRLSGLICH